MQKKKKEDRYALGIKAMLCGMVINFILSLAKIITGFVSGILVLVADGFHNLFDTGFLIVSIFSFKYANKPADKEHPFGHQRLEHVSSLILSTVLMVVGIDVIIEAIGNLISTPALEINIIALIVISVSAVCKIGLIILYSLVNKRAASLTIKASLLDSVADMSTSIVILASLLISVYTGMYLDSYLSLLVAGLILFNAIKIMQSSAHELIGPRPTTKLRNSIARRLRKHVEIKSLHDLVIHNYGDNNMYVSVHVVLAHNHTLEETNAITDKIIEDFKKDNINIVLQVEGEQECCKNS